MLQFCHSLYTGSNRGLPLYFSLFYFHPSEISAAYFGSWLPSVVPCLQRLAPRKLWWICSPAASTAVSPSSLFIFVILFLLYNFLFLPFFYALEGNICLSLSAIFFGMAIGTSHNDSFNPLVLEYGGSWRPYLACRSFRLRKLLLPYYFHCCRSLIANKSEANAFSTYFVEVDASSRA